MSDHKPWGPDNPHPLSRMRTELVWEGKYDEYGNRREVQLPNFPLVLQKVEAIDEPRDRERAAQGALFDEGAFVQSAHRDDFRNRLIWGDNKLALGALLNDFRGKVKLIYIDPPFDVGADFTMGIPLGDDGGHLEKDQSLIEAVAYRDTWGRSTDSYLSMMCDRFLVLRDLLADDGTIFVHCDWRVQNLLKSVLDELFPKGFRNQIAWHYRRWPTQSPMFQRSHDYLLWYAKGETHTWNQQYQELSESTLKRFGGKRVVGETTKVVSDEDSKGAPMRDVWEIPHVLGANPERIDYPTQKPEALLERVILAASNEGDLVADFFCGSGTTLAVAERLGRKWLGADLGRYAVHTTRKRLIGVQREMHKSNLPYRSFDVYNLGRYERQWWQAERLRGANEEHRATVLKFFRATAVSTAASPVVHGQKAGAYVHVDNIDSIFTHEELGNVARAIASLEGLPDRSRIKPRLIILAWEFEMDLPRRVEGVEAETGVAIQLKYIPREIMEANRDTVQFFDAAALDAEAVISTQDGKRVVDVKLTNFYPALTEVPDKELEALKERAVKSPFDFIDFWAIDFEYREDKPFEHHWQDYRTRKDRSLKTTSTLGWEYETKGVKRICVKVIDVFGIDTTKVIEVKV